MISVQHIFCNEGKLAIVKMNSVLRSKKDNFLYFMLSTDTDIRLLLGDIIEQSKVNIANPKNTVEKCIRAVVYFEINKGLSSDELPEDDDLDPYNGKSISIGECAFKFKCIVTLKEYLDGGYKSISEAAYITCTDENVHLVAMALDKGEKVKKKTGNVIVLSSAVLAFTGPFTGIFIVPIEWLAYIGMLSEKRISSILGLMSSKYTMYKIKKLNKSEQEDDNHSDTDFSQEYFDPTYVNM